MVRITNVFKAIFRVNAVLCKDIIRRHEEARSRVRIANTKVQRTIEALQRAVIELASSQPDELVIISPHQDHGFDVPEYYLGEHLPPHLPVNEILVVEPSYSYYYELGIRLGDLYVLDRCVSVCIYVFRVCLE